MVLYTGSHKRAFESKPNGRVFDSQFVYLGSRDRYPDDSRYLNSQIITGTERPDGGGGQRGLMVEVDREAWWWRWTEGLVVEVDRGPVGGGHRDNWQLQSRSSAADKRAGGK